MKDGNGFTPKYWIGHHKENDGVMLFSAAKNKAETCQLMEEAYGEDWFLDDNFEVTLVEIRKIAL